MKNLKKVLSLVLALAMALSLMTVAFAKDASDFADYSKVDFNEAVDVMVAAGVFDGVENNNFNPTAELTREQAAKIVTYMMIGADAADKLTTTVAPYADVAADRWSAGAIAWCTERGILAGSNGKFNPTGKLTGLAFSKMLLVALGYDAEIEKLVGGTWAINAATLAISNKLDKGLEGIALGSVLTREQACQMAFNTMKADLVWYDNKGTNITLSDGTNVVVGASAAATYNEGAHGTVAVDQMGGVNAQFAEKYCQKLALRGTTATDVFGRPATEWVFDGTSVGTYASEPTVSYEGEVAKTTLYSLVGKSIADNTKYYTAADASKGEYALTVWVDGAKQDATNGAVDKFIATGTSKGADSTGNGTVTEVYVDNTNKTIDVVIINTYLAQAAADYSTANKTLAVSSKTHPTTVKSIKNDDFAVSDFVKDDYILYTYANGKVQSIEKAKTMSGAVGTYTSGKTVTVDGTAYGYSVKFENYADSKTAKYTIGETATFVMDKQNNIIAIDSLTAANNNYIYIDAVAGQDNLAGSAAIATGISVEGTSSTVTLKSVGTTNLNSSNVKANVAKGWYTYSMDGDKYKLAADASKQYYTIAQNTETLVTNGAIAFGKADSVNHYYEAGKANSATVFIVKDADETIKVYTGIANVPTITNTRNTTFAYFYNDSYGYAKYVYIDVEATEGTTTASIDDKTSKAADVFYILEKGDLGVNADKKGFYATKVLKDGQIMTMNTVEGLYDTMAVGSLYYNATTNSDNLVSSITTVASSSLGTKGISDSVNNYYVSYSKNILTFKDVAGATKDYVLTDDAVVYVIVNGHASNADLLDDDNASYEVQTLSADAAAAFLNGKKITSGKIETLKATSDAGNVYNTVYLTVTTTVNA